MRIFAKREGRFLNFGLTNNRQYDIMCTVGECARKYVEQGRKRKKDGKQNFG